MKWSAEHKNARLTVKVHPRAKRSAISGRLRRLEAGPGRSAGGWQSQRGVRPVFRGAGRRGARQVRIVAGAAGRMKVVEIAGWRRRIWSGGSVDTIFLGGTGSAGGLDEGMMSDRGFLFLFSVLAILAGLGTAVWLLVTGQADSFDGIFLLLTSLTAGWFSGYI